MLTRIDDQTARAIVTAQDKSKSFVPRRSGEGVHGFSMSSIS